MQFSSDYQKLGRFEQAGYGVRSERYDFNSKIRLMVGCDPWTLVFTLKGINISTTGLLAHLSGESTKAAGMTTDDLDTLLAIGDTFHLQIEENGAASTIPHLEVVLRRKSPLSRTQGGLEVAFSFMEKNDPNIYGFLEEIADVHS